ncbi:extracellular solute-binding protein [Litoreibacter arenae]|uniref:Oligopeptide ABC transporter, periplasmic oligopeptide-binding protein OppA n=1 Tax=Litoreibacter arenae DSM 19593 TaxID=1123360 RepID=S9RV93_9RHOB|nr:extracellular solute-binding protein [Litoreibacter arenae]EPX77894.1 Oligopeptide ABC transporter, periplasmic oligopeptide-binding protein OppA [Litoreibacter arenae DSM 19593]
MSHRPPQVIARTRLQPDGSLKWMGVAVVLVAAALTSVAPARADTVTVSHGYSNFGELKYGPDFEHLDYVNPDAPKGGEVSTWSLGNFDSFNQYAREGVAAALNTIGSESLLTATADDPYGAYCFLCTTLEYPEDLSYVVFNLREDVTFSDGTPMTAEDVAFSVNLFLEQGIAEYRRIAEGFVDKVEVEGPYRIKFIFNKDASKRDRVGFAGGTPVFSKAWFEETGTRLDKSTDRPFMSTGAYVLDSFDYNRQVIYARNPDYWGEDIPFNVGRNNFDRIRVEYFADRSAAFEAFKSGEYLLKAETDPKDWATGYDFPAVKSGAVKLATLPDGGVGTALSFVFNLDREKWQDPKVRDAVSMLFNFEWTNKALFFDLYERPASFWPNTDLAATGTPSPEEVALLQPLVDQGLLDESILTDEVRMPFVNDDSKNRPSRKVLRSASKLLEEAGWLVGDDGIRRKDGQPLEVNIIQFNPLYDRVVNPFINNLNALGIKGSLERIDTAQYVERRRKGDFDLTNQGIQMDLEPSIGLEQWFSSKTADNSSRNLMRLRDPAVDALLPKVIAADTLDELRTSVHALDRVLRSIGFAIPQWYKNENWIAYYDVFRHPDELPPLAVGIYDFWWYDAEAAEKLKADGVLR